MLLGILTLSAATVGAWAAFTPRSFYDDFPGLGQIWVAVDGPYNEHLVRDVGALNLALAVVSVCALLTLSRADDRRVGPGAGSPTASRTSIYHARHLGVFDSAEAVAVIGSVASTSVVALAVLWLERSRVARV